MTAASKESSSNSNNNNNKGKKKKKEKEKENDKKASGGEKKAIKKTDVNVFKLDLSKVTLDSQVMTGDPSFCMKCAVALNHLSKVTQMKAEDLKNQNASLFSNKQVPAYCGVRDLFFPPDTNEDSASSHVVDKQSYENLPPEISVWTCEFCGFHNIIDIADEERPKVDPVDYVITPAPVGAVEEQNIIFCIDISGSMCVTTEVAAAQPLKGGSTDPDFAKKHGASGDQR